MKRRVSRRTILVVLGIAAVLLVVGIVLLLRASEEIFANIRMADCRWGATAEVWLDADRDGQRDADEQPLPNVAVHADDVANNLVRVTSAITDTTGRATLDVFVAGCPETAFEVYFVLSTSFCATTPERLSDAPYTFGVAECAT